MENLGNAEDFYHCINTTNQISNLQISNFALQDVGVYQCIFNAEATKLTMIIPFRLHTGKHSYDYNRVYKPDSNTQY